MMGTTDGRDEKWTDFRIVVPEVKSRTHFASTASVCAVDEISIASVSED